MTVHIDPSGSHISVPDSAGRPLPMSGPDQTLIRLTTPGGAEATLFAGVGFNLIDWRVPIGGNHVQIMHAEPDVLDGGSGTRSGCPILFPFPNRIAGASYQWEGREYHLPPAHPGDPNAIHGFCAKVPWSDVRATGASAATGKFRLSRDAAAVAGSWPGDLELSITFELADHALRMAARVTNVDDDPVPFGLGYHPYFTPLRAVALADTTIQVPAAEYWELADAIPTGVRLPVDGDRDLREPTQMLDRTLDDILTKLPPFRADTDGLMDRARLVGGDVALTLRADSAVRDMVVFTPANRQSVAIEPYTCPTDAVHLQTAGHDVGWRTLAPGESWEGVVEFVISRHPGPA